MRWIVYCETHGHYATYTGWSGSKSDARRFVTRAAAVRAATRATANGHDSITYRMKVTP